MFRLRAFGRNAVEGNDQLPGNRRIAFIHVRAVLTALHCRVIMYEEIFTFQGYAMEDHPRSKLVTALCLRAVFDALVSHDTEPIIKAQSTIKKNATLFMTISCLRQFVKPEPRTFNDMRTCSMRRALKSKTHPFWYDFRNDCASQSVSNLLEFLSAMRAFAQPVEELYSDSLDESSRMKELLCELRSACVENCDDSQQ